MRDRPLRLGTRNSPLALAQAQEARARLIAAHSFEEHDVELIGVTASGDRIQDRPLAEIGGKALWTKELDAALLAGDIDFAVHSAKDIETIRPEAIVIAAVLPREDGREGLMGAYRFAALPPGRGAATRAPRRAAQLLHARPDCSVVPIRGNVATRLAKLAAGEADATFLAAAGLNRLGQHGTGHPMPAGAWLPAPGQAAIAIECRGDDAATRRLLAAIDDELTRECVLAERALLAALGGTCHSPVAVLTTLEGDALRMLAAVFSPDGAEHVREEMRFAPGEQEGPARLAAALLARAPVAITEHFAGPVRSAS
jgi:hydroxymethylbilane synthase